MSGRRNYAGPMPKSDRFVDDLFMRNRFGDVWRVWGGRGCSQDVLFSKFGGKSPAETAQFAMGRSVFGERFFVFEIVYCFILQFFN